jgi:hypothetical protein
VTVTGGQTTAAIDATLATGALVSGSVTDSSGVALPGVCTLLEDTAGNPVVRQPTDASGNYEIDQLPAGRFILQFVDDRCVGRAPRYAPAFLGGATQATATLLELRAGQIAGRLDVTLDPLPPAAGTGAADRPRVGSPPSRWPPAGRPVAARPPAGRPVAARPVAARPVAARPVAARPAAARPAAARPAGDGHGQPGARRRGTSLVAGARAGSRSATIRPGRTHSSSRSKASTRGHSGSRSPGMTIASCSRP